MKESVSYFNHQENLEKIRCTNGPATIPIENWKCVTCSIGKSKKSSTCGDVNAIKTTNDMANCRGIDKLKIQKKNMTHLEAKSVPGKKSMHSKTIQACRASK
jgi:hypothetical protein